MLPDALAGVYAQYKRDTDSVAAWLASTAKASGYDVDFRASGGKSAATTSRKKKPKKPTVPVKYIIGLKDFVPLAKYIVACAEPVVPAWFSKTLDRVIALRRGFAAQLWNQGIPGTAEDDDKHSHFVEILEKVRDVLGYALREEQPSIAPIDQAERKTTGKAQKKTADKAEQETDIPGLTNIFSALDLYEPSQDFIDAPDISRSDNPISKDNDVYEVEPFKAMEDILVAYTIMINDLNKLRWRVRWIWNCVQKGVLDVAAAAIATNTAIDLGRDLISLVAPMIEQHKLGFFEMTYYLHCHLCVYSGIIKPTDVEDLRTGDPGTQYDYDTYDIADRTLFVAYQIMRTVQGSNILKKDSSMAVYMDHLMETTEGRPRYDPTTDRASLSGREKYLEDESLLVETISDLLVIDRGVENWPADDEMLRGMKEWNAGEDPPFWLVFASQIFLDISHLLREKTSIVFEKFMEQTTAIRDDFKATWELHEQRMHAGKGKQEKELLLRIENIRWYQYDLIYLCKEEAYSRKSIEFPMPASVTRHRLLQRSPVLAGLVLFSVRADYHLLALAIVNLRGSICSANHLYNALKQERLLKADWEDMDVVNRHISPDNFFIGGTPPTNRDVYFKRWCLQRGLSAAALSKENRPQFGSLCLLSKVGSRLIKDTVPVSNMFVDRYVWAKGSVNWTPEQIDAVVARSKGGLWGNASLMEFGIVVNPKILAQQKRMPTRDPQELVGALATALQNEVAKLSFPYLTLHRSCWRLFHEVNEVCEPTINRMYGEKWNWKESQLPQVVGAVFKASMPGMQEGDLRCLRLAMVAVDEFIKREGNVGVKASWNFH